MGSDRETETTESRLFLGCVTTMAVGVICYWGMVGVLREVIRFLVPGPNRDDTATFVVLSVLAAPLAIPLLGFIVLTLWRMAWGLMTGTRRPQTGTGDSVFSE